MSKKDARDLLRELKKTKYTELINLATKLPKDVKTIKKKSQVQGFILNNLIPAVENSIEKLEKINSEVTVIAPNDIEDRFFMEKSSGTYEYHECYHTYRADGTYDMDCYDWSDGTESKEYKALVYKLANEEITVLRSTLMATLNSLRVSSAYSYAGIDNIEATVNMMEDNGKELTDEGWVNLVNKHPNFLTLNEKHGLSQIVSTSKEVISGLLDFANIRDELCNEDKRSTFISGSELCLDIESEEEIRDMMRYTAGASKVVIGNNSAGAPVKVVVDVPTFLSNPIQDLKTLLPTKFDSNGEANWNLNQSVNGLFPNSELGEKLDQAVN